MREDDGRKLDHRTLEVLRLRAVDQVQRGVPAAEVGAGLTAVGIHPKTIYTWLAKARAGVAEGVGKVVNQVPDLRGCCWRDAAVGDRCACVVHRGPLGGALTWRGG